MAITKAYELPMGKLIGTAGADFSAKRYLACVRAVDGDVDVAGAAVAISGIIQDAVTAGQQLGIIALGVSFCVLGGTVTAGAEMEIDSVGRFIALASGISVGICEVGGAVDEIGCVMLK